jgi:hypothetical protein
MIAIPTEREFAEMVCEKLLTCCPVTVHNIDNANKIFGPDLANLRGKQLGQKWSTFELDMCWSLGILCNCIST